MSPISVAECTIVLWNTAHLNVALRYLGAPESASPAGVLAHLSPLG